MRAHHLAPDGGPTAVKPAVRPRFTGVRLLADNAEAWQAKRLLIGEARRSLALAYFIMDFDATTARLALDLVAAADRGVQVRVLVDHFMTFPPAPAWRALAAHPCIEVRRYRPPSAGWLQALQAAGIDPAGFVQGLVTTNPKLLAQATRHNRVLPAEWFIRLREMRPGPDETRVHFALRVLAAIQEVMKARADAESETPPDPAAVRGLREKVALSVRLVGGLKRYLRRTHHKLLLADERTFIMGGRNLADAYHRSDPTTAQPFNDLDIRARVRRGTAHEHVAAFEALWQQGADVRLPDSLDERPALTLADIAAKAAESDDLAARVPAKPGLRLPDMDGSIVNNLPSDGGDATITQAYIDRLQALAAQGQPAVVDIVNAYVCLTPKRTDSATLHALWHAMADAARAGVTVRVHTNSPTTTDLRLVNLAAYPRMPELLASGVQVWELQDGQGSLHAKSAALGDEWIAVGSYNFDPRSELYDTNNVILLHDPRREAARTLRAAMADRLRWRLLVPAWCEAYTAEHHQMALEFRSVRRLL